MIEVRDLGEIAFEEALRLQRELADSRKTGASDHDFLLLVEHPPVITHGRTSDPAHTLADGRGVVARGIDRFEVDRGGDVTYHGPGQVVGYPILHLGGFRKDLHWYLRRIEATLISTLGRFGIAGFRVEGHTGVWVGDAGFGSMSAASGDGRTEDATSCRSRVQAGTIRKIASIGVHASRWVTTHGFSLNHTAVALEGFRWIVPCGIAGVTMTSLEDEGVIVDRSAVVDALIDEFGAAFEATMRVRASRTA